MGLVGYPDGEGSTVDSPRVYSTAPHSIFTGGELLLPMPKLISFSLLTRPEDISKGVALHKMSYVVPIVQSPWNHNTNTATLLKTLANTLIDIPYIHHQKFYAIKQQEAQGP